ncbi:peroxiredoxin family protein [Planctomycetota bacterium]
MKTRQLRCERYWLLVAAFTALLIAGLTGCKKKAEQPPTAQQPGSAPTDQAVRQPVTPASTTTPAVPPRTTAQLPREPDVKLASVIATAKSWSPKEIQASGPIGDLSLVALDGTTHKLSNLRGKNVLITFWATSCPHCKIELPQLAKLRSEVPEQELAILTVSIVNESNTEAQIRQMVEAVPSINFPVVAINVATLPAPFNQVEYLPCSYFIDPEGTVKLVTEGMVTIDDMKTILKAG